jgi:hypothetical protein
MELLNFQLILVYDPLKSIIPNVEAFFMLRIFSIMIVAHDDM